MRGRSARWLTLPALLALLGCIDASIVSRSDATQQLRAVLVAGDGSLQVFDNAVIQMAEWLREAVGVGEERIVRLSSDPIVVANEGIGVASWDHVIAAIKSLKPEAGQGCFVFITSHGIKGEGIALNDSVLRPAEFDRALGIGCGTAPTVAIVSGCYSGSFAQPPMTRANRIVLTAARADRTSFGCGASETYTFFDQCLLTSLDRELGWRAVFDATRSCVAQRERSGGFVPSDPQGWFGPAVADLPLPRSVR